MLKILYVNSTAELGGTDTDLLETVRHLDRTRFAPTVLLPQPGPLDNHYHTLEVPVIYHNLGVIKRSHSWSKRILTLAGLPLTIFKLWRLMRREQFDLVINNSLLVISTGLAAKLSGKKVMWQSGELFSRPAVLKFLLYNLLGLLADRITVSSEAVRQLFPHWTRTRVITQHLGIDLTKFNPDVLEVRQAGHGIRQEFDIPTDAVVIGFVGRFIPWKGVKEFVLACAGLVQERQVKNVHFIAVGSCLPGYEDYFAEVQKTVLELGLKDYFHFATNRQDIPAFLAAFDIFVHASIKPEPFGIVILEALAMGKPVIATRGGGVTEILDNSNSGKLVEMGNVSALGAAISELVADQLQRQTLAKANRQLVLERFDINMITERKQKIYLEPFLNEATKTIFPGRISTLSEVEVSIIIVNYNGLKNIISCLGALESGLAGLKAEVFIVDNASSDSSLSAIKSWLNTNSSKTDNCYILLENRHNLGYAKANNQAIHQSKGEFVLLLNPDAEVAADAISLSIQFMRQNTRTGILGPRILLHNGKLDAPCRRSFKTPSIYLYKFLGLSKLFPRSHRFGKYYLSYLDENLTTEVDAVIGAFLLIRRSVINQIGLLDERYFIYCEDEDWCFQAKQKGWQVYYYPQAVVHHQKGASTRQRKIRMSWEWHKAVFKFHRKNQASAYSSLTNWLVYMGIGIHLLLTMCISLLSYFISKLKL